MSPLRRVKAKIGDLLLQEGLITEAQLQEAISLQKTNAKDKTLGQILLELGYVKKDDLYTVLAVQSGYPYLAIHHCVVNPKVLALLPESVVRKHQAFPIDKIHDIFTVAMVNPLDRAALEQIEDLVQSRVRVFLTTPADLEKALNRYYSVKT